MRINIGMQDERKGVRDDVDDAVYERYDTNRVIQNWKTCNLEGIAFPRFVANRASRANRAS